MTTYGDTMLDYAFSSASNEWYTPATIVEPARQVLGQIDLDPASNAIANETVKASRYYTIADDGLAQPWAGRVFLNPPYGKTKNKSNQGLWTQRLIAEYDARRVTEAIMVLRAATGHNWFAPLWRFPMCFVARRISFDSPGGASDGKPSAATVVVYVGHRELRFAEVFETLGPVVERVIVPAEYLPC